MKPDLSISARMNTIRVIFENSKALAETGIEPDHILEDLDRIDIEYRYVAYEGASMGFALCDFSNGEHLDQWHQFAKQGKDQNNAQIHVGLGWAIAQQNHNAELHLPTMEPMLQNRVVDGCGYYDGIFRQKRSVGSGESVTDYPVIFSKAYDQGIGRSIWYICKGESEKVSSLIQHFSEERQPGLWRGIGVAASCVGGFDESLMKALIFGSGNYASQLIMGAIITAHSRFKSGSLNDWTEAACHLWGGISATKAALIAGAAETTVNRSEREAFEQWMSKIETGLLQHNFNHQTD